MKAKYDATMADLLQFYADLAVNNNKPWFDKHKELYLSVKEFKDNLAMEIYQGLQQFDKDLTGLGIKDITYRIYQDLRFHDRPPYKTWVGIYVAKKGKNSPYAGYYLHIEPCENRYFICSGNIFLIGGFFAGWMLCGNDLGEVRNFLPVLSFLVLASGALQLVLMLILLKVYGRFPRWSAEAFRDRGIVKRLFKLALPGLIGGAALQVSFLADRLLAMLVGNRAVPALTFADRIIDLPIGIFALSLGTVLMAAMARSAASGDRAELVGDLAFGLRHVYFVCMPLAALVVFFHAPMLRLLCLGGNYNLADLAAARSVMIFYGMGIPCFCSIKVILPAFYARKVMDKPLYSSLAAIALNITLNLILMWPLKQGGIALATTLSSLVNNTILLQLLRREGFVLPDREIIGAGARSMGLAALIGWGCFELHRFWYGENLRSWNAELGIFCAVGALFAVAYLGATVLFRAKEPKEFLQLLKRRASASGTRAA